SVGSQVTITGANFTGVNAVRFSNNVAAQYTINSDTQIRATVPVGAVTGPITISKPNCSDVSTAAFTAVNPAPSLASITPNSTTVGGAAFTLTVNGSNFVVGSVVRWGGGGRTTTFVSNTRLTATIPASDIAAAGTASVTVFNPAPGGGVSNSLTFTTNPTGASVTTVSAASFQGQALASESIVAAFGANLATGLGVASGLPLPTALLGTTVRVRDSFGMERFAPLFFVAPAQVNFLMPAGTVNGAATITITSGNNSISVGTVQIASVAPGLFSANADGRGVAAGVVSRVRANSSQSYEPISQFDQALNQFVAIPIALGPPTDQVFLILYGTGIRFHSGPPAVTASIGGVNVEVLYAGHVIGLAGLDQVNLSLPRSLIGRGEVDVVITVDGKTANTVRVSIGSGAVQSTVSGQK
ncbi:MAG: IPT/TIG domain-containing protein, partial [Blastocatellia bacterium]